MIQSLTCAFALLAGVIGAGFSSGREIARFFAGHGEACGAGIALAVLALSFVQSVPGVTTTVLGCDNVAQLESNCQLFDQTVKLTDEQMKLLHDAFTGIDPRVINPRVWFKK